MTEYRRRILKGQNSQTNQLRERIRVECEMAGISKAELARRIGRTPQAFNAMLKRGDMKATNLSLVAEVLEVSMETLLTPVSDEDLLEAAKKKHKM